MTVEENVKSGGFGEHVAAYMEACHPEVQGIAVWLSGTVLYRMADVDSLRCQDRTVSSRDSAVQIEEYEDCRT